MYVSQSHFSEKGSNLIVYHRPSHTPRRAWPLCKHAQNKPYRFYTDDDLSNHSTCNKILLDPSSRNCALVNAAIMIINYTLKQNCIEFTYFKKLSHHSWFVMLQIPPQLCWGPNVMIWILMCFLWRMNDVSHYPFIRDAACIPSVKRIAIAKLGLKILNVILFMIIHIHIQSLLSLEYRCIQNGNWHFNHEHFWI